MEIEELYISLVSTDDGATWKRMDSWQSTNLNLPSAQQWTSPNTGWMCLVDKGIYKWPGYTGKHISTGVNRITYSTTASGEIGDTSEISFGNFGSSPTSINTFTLSSTNFSLVNAPATPIILQPWSTTELKIAFTPQRRGVFNDSTAILSDAANTSSLSVVLTGKGLEFTPILSNLIYAASESLYTISLANLKPLPVGKFEGTNKIEGLTISPTDSV